MEQHNREKNLSKAYRIINSTVCFSLAYMLITYSSFFMMGVVGKLFKFNSTAYYFGIRWMLNGHKWNKINVTLIYLANPLTALFIGLICLYIYDKTRHFKSMLNVFFVWGFVIGTSYFATQCAIASLGVGEYNSPYYQNFSVLFAWWRIPVPVVYFLNIPFIALLLYFSVNYTRPFLLFAYSYTKVNKANRRRKYFLETAVVPFILGCIVTTIITFPMNIFVHGMYLLMMTVALTASVFSLSFVDVMRDEVLKYKSFQQLSIPSLIVFTLACVLVFVTWRGINL